MEEIVLDRDILDPSPWIGGQMEKRTESAQIFSPCCQRHPAVPAHASAWARTKASLRETCSRSIPPTPDLAIL